MRKLGEIAYQSLFLAKQTHLGENNLLPCKRDSGSEKQKGRCYFNTFPSAFPSLTFSLLPTPLPPGALFSRRKGGVMVSSQLFFSAAPSSSHFPSAVAWDLHRLQGNLFSSAWSCCFSSSGQSSPSLLLSPGHLHPVHPQMVDYLFYKTHKGFTKWGEMVYPAYFEDCYHIPVQVAILCFAQVLYFFMLV